MLDIKANHNSVLTQLNQLLKNETFTTEFNPNEIATSSINKGYLNGRCINRVIFYLRGTGCAWCNTESGGCFMCGHYHGTTKGKNLYNNTKISHYTQFLKEFDKYDFSNFPMLCLYNAGSLLNADEITKDDLVMILNKINTNQSIKHLIIESRPEFITKESLSIIKENIKNKTVEIGIGLESYSDKIRSLCINKGFQRSEYIEAAKLIKEFQIKILTYLTVKPLFLTISESISDVVDSVINISKFTDVISLEPTSIQLGTLAEFFFKRQQFSIPKGWIIRDILTKINQSEITDKFELRIGGFEFYPIPKHVINNCSKCNKELYHAIDIYNTKKDSRNIMELKCDCENDYYFQKNIEDKNTGKVPLEKRISSIIAKELLNQQK